MNGTQLAARAVVIAMVLSLVHGCSATPPKAPKEESISKTVIDSMYTRKMQVTGSRIPRSVDKRKSLESQSPQPIEVITPR